MVDVKKQGFYSPKYSIYIHQITLGDVMVCREPNQGISTVLGSCIAACMWDPILGIGGMNHFLLPGDEGAQYGALSSRYGVHAMELLINTLLKEGCKRSNLKIKLFGGANLAQFQTAKIGSKNVDFVEEFVKKEGFVIAGKDLGGDRGRRILFVPAKGDVYRTLVKRGEESAVVQTEENFMHKKQIVEDDIELF